MPSDEEFEELKGRIVELENRLSERAGQRQDTSSLTPEELQAYAKVRDIIATDLGGFCGINDCFRCIIVRCLQSCVRCSQPCIFECTCGPCGPGLGGGGIGRFSGLGG
jgi:hypothetical protein